MIKAELSSDDKRRYIRNIKIEDIGLEGQRKLLNSTISIVGCGALGSIAAMYLAASGVGHIRLFDFDTIDISNLQRQLSFEESILGQKKVDATKKRLHSINSSIKVDAYDVLITKKNIADCLSGCDLVIEGSDNPDTKYLVSEACEQMNIPYVLGGVSEFQGQVMSWKPDNPGYKEIFPNSAESQSFMPCGLGGVLGPLPGIIGSIQSAEAIKILCGIGKPLFGRLMMFDALTMECRVFRFS